MGTLIPGKLYKLYQAYNPHGPYAWQLLSVSSISMAQSLTDVRDDTVVMFICNERTYHKVIYKDMIGWLWDPTGTNIIWMPMANAK